MQQSKILIADDQDLGREILCILLEKEGYLVEFASNGLEALEKTKEFLPDLILLDVMMPKMNGFEVCQALRQDPILAEVPIILLTALNDQQSMIRGFEVGADDFISKPIKQIELLARIRTITRLNRYRQLITERTKFDWIIENAEDGYIIIDKNDEIIYVNPKACQYLHVSQDVFPIKERLLAIVSERYSFLPKEELKNWPVDINFSKEYFLVKPETPVTPAFWLKLDILKLPDQVGNILIRLRDVTYKVNLEQSIWKFNTFIEHKMRTPLTVILGGLEFLEQMGDCLPIEELIDISKLTLDGVKRLKDSIEDVLTYVNEPLSGKDMKVVVQSVETMINNLAQNLDIVNINISWQENIKHLQISLSENLFELVLREILENAKKFHPKHSPKIEVNISSTSTNTISVKFIDDGITLTPKQISNLWQPYYQGEKFFTGQVPGMGLGLTTVAKIVSSVGGSYQLYNREQLPGVVVELSFPTVGR